MPLPTTRRGRFLYRRNRYLRRLAKWKSKRFKWRAHISGDGMPLRKGPNPDIRSGFLSTRCDVSSASYDAVPAPVFGLDFVVSVAGYANPPHVRIDDPFYDAWRASGYHQRRAFIGYHVKRVRWFPSKLTNVRRTPLERQITGCNWFYWRNEFYKDDDVLGRHPTESEVAGGAPSGPPGWPVPLGY